MKRSFKLSVLLQLSIFFGIYSTAYYTELAHSGDSGYIESLGWYLIAWPALFTGFPGLILMYLVFGPLALLFAVLSLRRENPVVETFLFNFFYTLILDRKGVSICIP